MSSSSPAKGRGLRRNLHLRGFGQPAPLAEAGPREGQGCSGTRMGTPGSAPPLTKETRGRASANEDAGLCIGGAARLFPPIAWGSPGISHACPFRRGLLKEGCPSDDRWGPPTDLDVLASGLSAHGMGTLVPRDSGGLLGCQPAGTWMQWPGDAGSSPGQQGGLVGSWAHVHGGRGQCWPPGFRDPHPRPCCADGEAEPQRAARQDWPQALSCVTTAGSPAGPPGLEWRGAMGKPRLRARAWHPWDWSVAFYSWLLASAGEGAQGTQG